MLPVSNMYDGQTNRFSLPTHHYSGISAVEDVGGHPEIMVKCTRPNFHATPTNHDHDHYPNIWERQRTGRSWEACQQFNKSCLLQLFKKTTTLCSGTNFDANQGEFIQTTALSINFSKQNDQIVGKKTPIEACLVFSISKLLFISALICSKGQQNKS